MDVYFNNERKGTHIMNESPQAKAVRESLPEDLRKVVNKVSFSYQAYLQIINEHLVTLYGDTADWSKCLYAYFNSPIYRDACHKVKKCGEIPIIKKNHIEHMLNEEAEYAANVNDLLKCYHAREETPSVENGCAYTYKMASILGLLPEKNEHSLYHWIIQKNNISTQEQFRLKQRLSEQSNLLGMVTDLLTKMFIPGYLLEFPHVGSVMTQQKGEFYYRGENAFYGSSKASYFRGRNINQQPAIFHLVDHLRTYECWNLLDQFDAIKHWSYSSINYMALAQHYGFRTKMMDVTSDLKTALFFACCYYDDKDRKWHPLKRADIEHSNSRKRIAVRGGDSRYGILYRTPTEITDMKWALSDESSASQIITPIGYQPFMRCSHQHGYMMLTNNDTYDLYQDDLFDKYRILLDEELCTWIYEEMDRGNAVYPNDDVPDISQYFEKLNYQCSFSESVFQTAMQDLVVKTNDITAWREVLSGLRFSIKNKTELIKAEQLAQINKQYGVNHATQKIAITPQLFPLIRI